MARDPRSCSCSRWSVPLNTALIYSYLRLLQCSLLYIHYGNGTRCVPSERSRAASSPARVSDTFDNPINIYEALYWNNTELLYTHTYVGFVVCVWVCECSTKRATRGKLAASCQGEHAENSMAFGEAACTVPAAAVAAARTSLIRTIVPFRCGALMRSAWSDRARERARARASALPLLFSIF